MSDQEFVDRVSEAWIKVASGSFWDENSAEASANPFREHLRLMVRSFNENRAGNSDAKRLRELVAALVILAPEFVSGTDRDAQSWLKPLILELTYALRSHPKVIDTQLQELQKTFPDLRPPPLYPLRPATFSSGSAPPSVPGGPARTGRRPPPSSSSLRPAPLEDPKVADLGFGERVSKAFREAPGERFVCSGPAYYHAAKYREHHRAVRQLLPDVQQGQSEEFLREHVAAMLILAPGFVENVAYGAKSWLVRLNQDLTLAMQPYPNVIDSQLEKLQETFPDLKVPPEFDRSRQSLPPAGFPAGQQTPQFPTAPPSHTSPTLPPLTSAGPSMSGSPTARYSSVARPQTRAGGAPDNFAASGPQPSPSFPGSPTPQRHPNSQPRTDDANPTTQKTGTSVSRGRR